jgi:hypothetical protein
MLTTVLLLGWLTGETGQERIIREFEAARAQRKERARSVDAALKAELSTRPLPPWAATYCTFKGRGDGCVTLAPRAGFLLTTRGCLPDSEEWDYGPVTTKGSTLHLRSSRVPERSSTAYEALLTRLGHEALDMDLVPIIWGERHYLVLDRELQRFCREIRDGRQEPAFGAFLRGGDEKRAVSGRPRTPDSELRCLDEQSLAARIVAVRTSTSDSRSPGRIVATHVVLDVGAKDGVRTGMRFYFRGTKSYQSMFTVVGVKKQTSDALIRYQPLYGDRPRRGWRLSTDSP